MEEWPSTAFSPFLFNFSTFGLDELGANNWTGFNIGTGDESRELDHKAKLTLMRLLFSI
jgi:hypothetical protein